MRRISLLDVLCLVHAVHAVSFPFEVWHGPSKYDAVSPSQRLEKRGAISIKNFANSVYVSNITLGGGTIPVMLDTGSSDLWVTGSVPSATDSKKSVELHYAVGTASGDIFFADMTIANHTVKDQAFLLVTDTSSFSANISTQGYQGLIGLGPNTGSLIRDKLDRDDFTGDAVLDRVFQLNETTSNYITFMLDRKNDPGSTITGQFTISEVVTGFGNITSQPKLDIVTVPGLTDRDQHWQMYTDVNGFIGPDGQPLKIDSIVHKAPDGQLVAVVDSGFTLPQVPRDVSDQIYGRVQGAEWNAENAVWTIPCGQMLNISLKFGGVEFPIHPLDASSSDFGLVDSNGNSICVGTFQPITSAFSLLGEYDIILGMSFLRNSYTLIDLGKFVEGSSKDDVDGYIQMLPLTDKSKAHADFVQVRLNGVDTTGDPKYYLLPASEGQHSPESAAEKKAHLAEKVLSRWPYILLGLLLGFILIVGLIIWKCCCRRRCQERRKAKIVGGAAATGEAGGIKGVGKRLSVSMNALQMNTLGHGGSSSYHPIGGGGGGGGGGGEHGQYSPSSSSYNLSNQQQYNHHHPPSYHSGYSGHHV